jgi:hypothetical protein
MTKADLTSTSQDGAQHTRLRPDWYLRVGLENDAPLVERRAFWRALVRLVFRRNAPDRRAKGARVPITRRQ